MKRARREMPIGMRISLISADQSSDYLIHAQAITHGGGKEDGSAAIRLG
jgi:hypothetical protein